MTSCYVCVYCIVVGDPRGDNEITCHCATHDFQIFQGKTYPLRIPEVLLAKACVERGLKDRYEPSSCGFGDDSELIQNI